MWIFMNDAFFSIVEDENDRSKLTVRARLPEDIESVFPGAKSRVTPDRDYRYRTSLPRSLVADAIFKRVKDIDYPNFKASIPNHQAHRAHAYGRVWGVMYSMQEQHLIDEEASAFAVASEITTKH